MSTKAVQALLDDIRLLGNEQYFLVESVRALVKETVPSSSEEVKQAKKLAQYLTLALEAEKGA